MFESKPEASCYCIFGQIVTHTVELLLQRQLVPDQYSVHTPIHFIIFSLDFMYCFAVLRDHNISAQIALGIILRLSPAPWLSTQMLLQQIVALSCTLKQVSMTAKHMWRAAMPTNSRQQEPVFLETLKNDAFSILLEWWQYITQPAPLTGGVCFLFQEPSVTQETCHF